MYIALAVSRWSSKEAFVEDKSGYDTKSAGVSQYNNTPMCSLLLLLVGLWGEPCRSTGAQHRLFGHRLGKVTVTSIWWSVKPIYVNMNKSLPNLETQVSKHQPELPSQDKCSTLPEWQRIGKSELEFLLPNERYFILAKSPMLMKITMNTVAIPAISVCFGWCRQCLCLQDNLSSVW